jgi:hypothetical protein
MDNEGCAWKNWVLTGESKMSAKKVDVPCVVCNPAEAEPDEYCEAHREQLHRLDHQYETLFRFQRTCRGRGHEIYEIFLQGECDPRGRVLVAETDPDNLSITILLADDLDLDTRLTGYSSLGIEKSYGDYLREKLQQEVVYSWYGNARACVDIFRLSNHHPQHWDLEPRLEQSDDDGSDPRPPAGNKHSIH